MALEAVAVDSGIPGIPAVLAPPRSATIQPLRPATRADTVSRLRRERRRWFVAGALLFGAPVVACLGVLEVVR